MRITRDSLIQSARQFATQQVRRNRRLVCIYLVGSLLGEEPLLGGNTDIDLFFIHDSDPPQEREIIFLIDDVHLDIAHLSQGIFRQPREQRTSPWLAPSLCNNPICLHDTQHWFEFTQASVCAQYERPDYVLQRAKSLEEQARQLWLDLKSGSFDEASQKVFTYLRSLEKAANSIATLSGIPLTERRFLLLFPKRTENIGRPGLASGFIDLIMPQPVAAETWSGWLADWEEAFTSAGEAHNPPAKLHPQRLSYYKNAALSLWEDHPAAALWPLLRTWTLAITTLPEENALQEKWKSAMLLLGINPDQMEDHIKALDAYLDQTEETLDLWARNMGI